MMSATDDPGHSSVNPILLREAFNDLTTIYTELEASHFILLRDEESAINVTERKAPFRLQAGVAQRFIQHKGDVSLAYHQLSKLSKNETVMLESIIPGSGFWTLGIVQHGRLIPQGCCDVTWADELHQFPIAISFPGNLDESSLSALTLVAQSLIECLEIPDGPVRVEWLQINITGSFHILGLETGPIDAIISADLPGLAGGISFQDNYERLLNDEGVLPYSTPSKSSVLHWLHSRSGIVEFIERIDEARTLEQVEVVKMNLSIGQRIGHVVDTKSRDALGYVVATGASNEEAITVAKRAVETIRIHTKTVY